ncbi:MAG: DsbA family protein [Gemmatimonadaceae bacterium]
MHHWTMLLRLFAAATTASLTLAACAPSDSRAPAAAVESSPTSTTTVPPETPFRAASPVGVTTAGAGAVRASAPRRVVLHGVDLTGTGYDKGSPDAPIVMVDFSDFGCPFCGRHALETQPALEREFVATGKVFYKYVPFVMGMFPNGDVAARAAECAAEQGKFWEMHDALYANQSAWKRGSDPAAAFRRHAVALGMNTTRFDACYTEDRGGARTRRATEAAERIGIRATPTFFIDGRAIEGALPLDQFRRLLTELAR